MTVGIQISALPTAPVLSGAELIPLVSLGHVSGITRATNAVITINDTTGVNPFSAGQQVYIAGVGGMTQINGLGAVVSAVGGSSGAWTLTVPINSSGFSAYTSGGQVTTTVNIPLLSVRLSAGTYNPTFQSGNVQYAGPTGTIAGDNNLIFGLAIPNPSGTPGPCLLLGSGGGFGLNVSFWVIQDQAFDTGSPGNDLGITAGEVQPGSSQRGGNLWQIAGAADLGTGGSNTQQGGTSARGPGGMQISLGGNNTDGSHPPGDNFVIAGEVGSQGANTHIIGTILNGIPGVIHLVRFNSSFVVDAFSDGRLYSYASNGFGSVMAPWISRGSTPGQAAGWAGLGELFTGTKTVGSSTVTIVNGLIVSWT